MLANVGDRRGLRRLLHAAVAVAVTLFVTSSASAQVPLDRFSVNRFTPAPGAGNYLTTDGALVMGHTVPSFGVTLDYGHRLFELKDVSCTDPSETNCEVDGTNTELVSFMAQANLWGAITLFDRLQVGLVLPLALTGGDDFNRLVMLEDGGTQAVSILGGTRFAVGDPTLSLKARIYGDGEGINFGAALYGTFPIANQMQEEGFLGDESVRVGGHLIAQLITSGFHLAANVGGFWRPEAELFSTRAASQITYKVAVGYEVTPLILVYGELDGASGLSSELDEHPLEGRLGARYRHDDLTFGIAGGAGIIAGVGVPQFRFAATFAYAPMRGDRDGDGISDDDDACPTEREDVDEWEDEDGCPEPDNDGDGLLDDDDPCPIQAEDVDGFEDEDGCPDEDNDGDGVRDGFDSCPSDPEDMDGDRDEDGCPDNDTDRDGIEDVDDQCPEVPEDADGFGDEDGCPEEDFDGDGVVDDMDECPDQAEIINGIRDEDGCPEEDSDGDGVVDEVDQCANAPEHLNGARDDDGCPDGPALVTVEDGILTLTEPVGFRRGTRLVHRGPLLLATVATAMRYHPSIKIRVHVTASTQELANERADAIVAFLAEHDVPRERIDLDTHAGDDEVVTIDGRDVTLPAEEPAAAAPAAEAEASEASSDE